MKWSGTWHPLAERFPMLDEDELREMAVSIAERGQYVPCRMTPDGLGLDGRNRVAACVLADVAPAWQVYDGDAVTFIVEVNAERRHLTTGQRAMAVAIGLVEAGQRRNGKFDYGSKPPEPTGTRRLTWTDALAKAGLVLDHAPELADAVLAGGVALDAAHKQADGVRDQKKRVAALGGELAKLVHTGVIDLDEAERRHAEGERLATLPDDLAERVNVGTLTLDEAEVIKRQNNERLDAWAGQIRASLGLISRMAGHPIPGGITERLSGDENALLMNILVAASQQEEPA